MGRERRRERCICVFSLFFFVHKRIDRPVLECQRAVYVRLDAEWFFAHSLFKVMGEIRLFLCFFFYFPTHTQACSLFLRRGKKDLSSPPLCLRAMKLSRRSSSILSLWSFSLQPDRHAITTFGSLRSSHFYLTWFSHFPLLPSVSGKPLRVQCRLLPSSFWLQPPPHWLESLSQILAADIFRERK